MQKIRYQTNDKINVIIDFYNKKEQDYYPENLEDIDFTYNLIQHKINLKILTEYSKLQLKRISHFCFINGNHRLMKQCFQLAINKYDDVDALFNIAIYYKTKQKTRKMYDYYLKAATLNHTKAMICLGYFFISVGNDNEGINYFMKAYTKGDYTAINDLGVYYSQKKEYSKMKYCYMLGATHDIVCSLHNLAIYYVYYCYDNDICSPSDYYLNRQQKKIEASKYLNKMSLLNNLANTKTNLQVLKNIENMSEYIKKIDF